LRLELWLLRGTDLGVDFSRLELWLLRGTPIAVSGSMPAAP